MSLNNDAVSTKTSEFDEAAKNLDKSLSELSDSIQSLLKRLEPIMICPHPSSEDDCEKSDPHSEIVDRMYGYSKGVKSMNDIVQDILSRLEI